MKKWLKYIGIFIGGYLLATIVVAVGQVYFEKNQSVFKNDVVIDQTFSAKNIGLSMEPTLRDGSEFRVDPSHGPAIGDIVAFVCYTDSCVNGGKYYSGGAHIKRLTDINDQGCYYFLGDNLDHSWDSRDYGWLCPPNDLKIDGVVVK